MSKGRIKLLFLHAKCGKGIRDKLKIIWICILRFLKERGMPKMLVSFLESTVYDMSLSFKTGVKMKIRCLDDYFICCPLHEQHLSDYFNLYSGVFLDIGAHIGKYTLIVAKKLGNNGFVIAVEPEKSAYNFLLKNIKLNNLNNVIPLKLAAYSHDTTLKLYHAPEPRETTIMKDYGIGYEIVKARALDNVLKDLGVKDVDLVKIDVEGSEYDVLKGMKEILGHSNPRVIIEVINGNRDRVLDFMSKMGYKGNEIVFERGEGSLGHYSYFVFERKK